MKTTLQIFTYLVIILTASPTFAGSWLIYHKPAFKGKVIDAETKKPIEGAVVVVTYSKTTHFPPEAQSSIINIKETLTDKNGEFYIPSYTTLIQPLSTEEWARFIIFKPGYGSYPDYQVSPPKVGVHPEDFFSTSQKTGTEGEVRWLSEKIKVTFGVVELPKLKTKEERLRAMPSPEEGSGHHWAWYRKKQKQFIRLLNEENKNLGLTGEYNIK